MSRLFHFMALHEHRIRLGETALHSAAELDDYLAKAEIFLDDLGWANYLRGNKTKAVANVGHAIEILKQQHPTAAPMIVQTTLLHAKAERHLAMLVSNSSQAIEHIRAAASTPHRIAESTGNSEHSDRRSAARSSATETC
ncbi:unnamed protein product [Sphagnum jensenii]|uniref:Uncharacterized protein n=1 Tax=Sphagnum jensenii TaxID=128206 RepID=A0ABP0VGN4_9BRYO